MARSIETNEDARRREVRETPVPSRRSAGPIVRGHEGLLGGAEPPGVVRADGEPDEVEDEVE